MSCFLGKGFGTERPVSRSASRSPPTPFVVWTCLSINTVLAQRFASAAGSRSRPIGQGMTCHQDIWPINLFTLLIANYAVDKSNTCRMGHLLSSSMSNYIKTIAVRRSKINSRTKRDPSVSRFPKSLLFSWCDTCNCQMVTDHICHRSTWSLGVILPFYRPLLEASALTDSQSSNL